TAGSNRLCAQGAGLLVVHAGMDHVRPSPPATPSDAPTPRPLALVTPLFGHQKNPSAWPSMTVELPTRRKLRQGHAVLAALLALAGAGVFHSHQRAQRVANRVEVGCFDVDDCRALVHLAEASADSCWFGCASHVDL